MHSAIDSSRTPLWWLLVHLRIYMQLLQVHGMLELSKDLRGRRLQACPDSSLAHAAPSYHHACCDALGLVGKGFAWRLFEESALHGLLQDPLSPAS